jgi:hypothetical protein
VNTVILKAPLPTKVTVALPPIINATLALKSTFGSAAKGVAGGGMAAIPPNRPKTLAGRASGNRLSPATPPTLPPNPRLTSQVRATNDPKATPPIVKPPIDPVTPPTTKV